MQIIGPYILIWDFQLLFSDNRIVVRPVITTFIFSDVNMLTVLQNLNRDILFQVYESS